jgi:uncharacterized Zn finger protein
MELNSCKDVKYIIEAVLSKLKSDIPEELYTNEELIETSIQLSELYHNCDCYAIGELREELSDLLKDIQKQYKKHTNTEFTNKFNLII